MEKLQDFMKCREDGQDAEAEDVYTDFSNRRYSFNKIKKQFPSSYRVPNAAPHAELASS